MAEEQANSVRDQNTQDFVKGLKEREELKAQLAEKEREVNNLKGQNYDLMKKLDSLQTQVRTLCPFRVSKLM